MARFEEYNELMEELEDVPQSLSQTTQRCCVRMKKYKNTLWWKFPVSAVAAFLIVFCTLANTSIAFARAIGEVPVLREFAKCVTFDPSLKAAVDNKYVQPVGLSQTNNGITFSIPYIIADRQRLVVFYKLESESTDVNELGIYPIELINSKGKNLIVRGNGYCYQKNGPELHSFSCDVKEGKITDPVVLNLLIKKVNFSSTEDIDSPSYMKLQNLASYSFKIPIVIIKESQVYFPNQTVNIQNQKITVKKVEISPTVTKVSIETDPNNTAILREIEMSLKDDSNRVWNNRIGLVSMVDENRNVKEVYFESNFFSDAKNFKLSIDKISLLKKSEQKVKVDLKNRTTSPLPDYVRLKLIQKDKDNLKVMFATKGEAKEKFVFESCYWDAEGNKYHINENAIFESENEFIQLLRIKPVKGDIVYVERVWEPTVTLEQPVELQLN